jgi:hypothetical protein
MFGLLAPKVGKAANGIACTAEPELAKLEGAVDSARPQSASLVTVASRLCDRLCLRFAAAGSKEYPSGCRFSSLAE